MLQNIDDDLAMPAAISPPPESGFFYILSQPKPEYIQEYHDWYNTEHGPLRMKLDFITNGYRYRCTDEGSNAYLAVYDLARIAGLQEPRYTILRSKRSKRETRVFEEQLEWLDRRVYRDISSRGRSEGPAPVLMTVSLLVRDELVSDVNRWYEKVREPGYTVGHALTAEQEHINDLSRIPGWRRTRRFELVEADDQKTGYTELLAVHDFDETNGLDGAEHISAKLKPWRNRIMAQVESRVNRRFEFFHEFKALDYREP